MTITVPILGTLAGVGAFVFVMVAAILVISVFAVGVALLQGRRY